MSEPDYPTVRLGDGGDVPTYDDLTVAAVLDEHTDHLRQLEGQVRALARRATHAENRLDNYGIGLDRLACEVALSPWDRLVRWVREKWL